MKSLLFIGKTNQRKVKNALIKYSSFYRQVDDVVSLQTQYQKDKFDLCIVFDNYHVEKFRKIIAYILSIDKNQKILVLQKNSKNNCFLENKCLQCNKSHNIITLKEPFYVEQVMGIVEDFSPTMCQSLIQSYQEKTLYQIKEFESINPKILRELIGISQMKFFEAKSIISYSDEKQKIYYLLSGCLRLFVGGKKLKNITLKTICETGFLVDSNSFQNENITLGIESMSDVYLVEFPKESFFQIAFLEPRLMELLYHSLLKELDEYKYLLWKNFSHDSLQKVCLKIVENKNILKYKNKAELSEELNMSQETLSRALRKLKDEGVLDEGFNVKNFDLVYTILEENM